jgi:hypothetical protein
VTDETEGADVATETNVNARDNWDLRCGSDGDRRHFKNAEAGFEEPSGSHLERNWK